MLVSESRSEAEVDMKVTAKKGEGFYVRAAKRFLEGYEDLAGAR